MNSDVQITGSLDVTGGITGSLLGTASFATSALSSSHASFALTSSNVQGGEQYYIPLWDTDTSLTSSYLYQNNNTLKTFDFGINKGLTLSFLNDEYFLGNTSSSYGGLGTWINVDSGDGAITLNSDNYTIVENKLGIGIVPTNRGLAVSGALEITGPSISKFMNSDVQITGSLDTIGQQTIQGNILFSGSISPSVYSNDPSQSMIFGFFENDRVSGSYFQAFGDSFSLPSLRGNAQIIYDSKTNPDADFHVSSHIGGNVFIERFLVNNTGAQVTGSLEVSNGITGSLLGTASYAVQALSSSFATTASYVLNAVSASYADQALSSSYAVTASYVEIFPYTGSAKITGSLDVTGSIESTTVRSNIFINNQTINTPIFVPSGSNALIVGPVNLGDEVIVEDGGNLYVTDFTNPTPNLQEVTNVGNTTTNSITAANFITTSDRRLKSDIKQIENPFELLGNIKSYEYIKDGKKDAGFIAQEIQETIPYAVFENEEGMLTMSDRPLLAYLYAAVMELKEENKQLRERLGAINNKL